MKLIQLLQLPFAQGKVVLLGSVVSAPKRSLTSRSYRAWVGSWLNRFAWPIAESMRAVKPAPSV
jgi:hypothetical protein